MEDGDRLKELRPVVHSVSLQRKSEWLGGWRRIAGGLELGLRRARSASSDSRHGSGLCLRDCERVLYFCAVGTVVVARTVGDIFFFVLDDMWLH